MTSSADLIALVTKKIMALIKVSTEVAEDAAVLGDFVSSLAWVTRSRKSWTLAFFSGDGTQLMAG